MSNFTSVIRNTLAQAGGKFATLTLSLVVTSILTRALGVEGYGHYTFITAFILLFGNIADWGTNIISVREASSNPDTQPKIFGSITLFRSILVGFAILLANIAIRLNPSWDTLAIPTTIASVVLIGLSLKTSFGIVFQTKLRFDLSVWVEILASSIFLIFILVFPNGLNAVLYSWILSTFLASILAFLLASKLTKYIWVINTAIVKKIFKEALPAGALFLVFTIYNRIDTIILQSFSGSHAVGIYGLAYKMHDNFVMGAAYFMNSLFPILSLSFSQKRLGELKNIYQKSFDLLFVGSLVLFISIFSLAPLLVNILGGSDFSESVGVLRILLLATVIAYFNHLTGYSLIAFGKQRLSLAIAATALTINVLANWIFIPTFSYKAAAWITVATEGLVLLLSSIVVAKTIGMYPSLFSWPKTLLSLLTKRTVNI